MGIPKFFRYISERYPCLSELAREQSIPHFDNLYLDMNGIIHNCSHPDDNNIHFHITEEDMFKDITNYIDKLFFLIKPRKVFFMAVDGVAPRAKMNQQRSRRYRSAKEAELLANKARSRGEVVNNERFDSNCITPGTEFMCRLHEALRHFIKSKISTDPMWQKCRIILSGHDSPGEGEHKIMDYIRYIKSRKDHDPKTRHCLYGLDADLIILGLCTHELHFVVLREEVKFGRKTTRAAVEETRFFLLHLGLLREYLELEFSDLRQQDPSLDIDKLIDDWILMGFLVGNDFIPHLPCLHICSNALPLLYKSYIRIYPTLRGNINEKGKLNLERLEKYFVALSEVEFDIFRENYVDLKYFETKQLRNDYEAFEIDVNDITREKADNDLADFIESSKKFFEEDDGSSDGDQDIVDEFKTHKKNYYMKKLQQSDMSSEQKRDQAVGYVTALQWILDYYYHGVPSWEWYYPHHYAPFISDLQDFRHHTIKFNMGKPFLPFEQLLAVLPPASRDLLPAPYRSLMTSSSSEIKHFYPNDFETDLNGKKQDWEAVVLIPFIDQNLLLQAMKTREQELTERERKRNQHGPMLQYDYISVSKGVTSGTCSIKAFAFWPKETTLPADKSVCRATDNAVECLDFCPGFPTMKHLKYDSEIKMLRVKVFDQPSRNESLLLLPKGRPDFNDLFFIAQKFLNQSVFIGWPHLIKAKVIAVSNKEKVIDKDGVRDMDLRIFQLNCKSIQEHLTGRMGIQFNDYSVLVHANANTGTTHLCDSQGKVTVKDVWSPITTYYPAQGIVSGIDLDETTRAAHQKQIESLFPVSSTIFFLGKPYFGSEGVVLNPLLFYECGRLKINITVLPEPDFTEAKDIQSQLDSDYVNAHQASMLVGLSLKCLNRITGTVLVVLGQRRPDIPDSLPRINIGLQLKFPKMQEERAGYARRLSNQWCYSSKAVALIKSYCLSYPMVIEHLSKSSDRCEFYFESDLFPHNVGEGHVEAILSWIKTQHQMKAERIACGSKTVEKEAIEKLLESIENLKTLPVKTVKLQVKPYLLLKPDIKLPDAYKSRTVKLFDRIVIIRSTYMIPLGSKGTVVGIFPVTDPNPVRLECLRSIENFLEVLFDKQLPNGNAIHGIATKRVYKVAESSVLLIHNLDISQPEHLENKSAHSSNDFAKKGPTIKHNLSEEGSGGALTFLSRKPVANTIESNANVENFWLPSMKEKVNESAAAHTSELPTTAYLNSVTPAQATCFETLHSQRVNSSAVQGECRAGTQVLKNLLGLVGNHNTTSTSGLLQSPEKYMDVNRSLQNKINYAGVIPQYESITATLDNLGVQRNPDNHARPFSVVTSVASQEIGRNLQTFENNFSKSSLGSWRLNHKYEFIPPQTNPNDSKHHALTNSASIEEGQKPDSSIMEIPNVQSSKENRVDVSNTAALVPAKTHNKRNKPPRTPKIGAKFDYAL